MKHLIFALCIVAAFAAKAQPGTLDISFGKEGIVTGESYTGYARATALQKDGKIVVAGIGGYNDIGGSLVARYNADGSIDQTFGYNGLVVTAFYGQVDGFYCVAIQEDGKILAGGRLGATVDAGVVRYLPDGTIDSSFGENGIALTDLGEHENVTGMALQSDGKILLTGLVFKEYSSNKYFLMRYNSDGILDEGFGDKGIIVNKLDEDIEINSIVMQPNGKIIIAGIYSIFVNERFLLIRYMPDGTLDPSFSKTGIAKISYPPSPVNMAINSVALQEDGKIIIAGETGPTGYTEFLTVARIDADGSLDKSFGNEGAAVTKLGNDVLIAYAVMVQPDGKIVAVGYNNHANANSNFLVVRYMPDGVLDSTFGTNGLESTTINQSAGAYAGVIQEDGKIIAVGDNTYSFTIARYNGGDAILPITYSKFTATQTKATITLNWQTTTELNNSYFAVERSSNAVNYAAVAQVNSVATGAAVQDYAYTDKLPLAGNNYYRLKQVDKDGKFSYSKTVSIAYLKPGSIQLFPNPAKDRLTIKGLNAAITSTIAVLDIQGKQLLQFAAKAATYSFSIGSLAPGTYMVRVKDDNETKVEKFVKE